MATTNLGRVMPVDKGAYSANATYQKLDMVHTSDSTYVSKVNNNTGHAVTDTDYWQCYADGKPATTAAAAANTAAGRAEAAADTAASDHTRAEQDHTTAASDHTQAASDHSTAASDHTRAGEDHSTAASDHTRAGEDHTTAASDHTQAASDHSTAASDHSTAASDHTSAASDHTQAGEDHAQYLIDHASIADKVDKEYVDDNFARKDGYYEQMGVGIAKNLEGRVDVVDSFFMRPAGGQAEISNGPVQLKSVAGISKKFNQLVEPGATSVDTLAGHKYFACIDGSRFIFTEEEDNSIDVYSSDDNVIDLTAMEIDNLTTVAEVEAYLEENFGLQYSYDYDAGSIINVNMTGVRATGRNLLLNGVAKVPGVYSEDYDAYYGIVGTYDSIEFVDKLGETQVIEPDSDGKFLIEVPGEVQVTNPGANCSVFMWWDGSKTDYSEFEQNDGVVDVAHIYGKKNGTGSLVQVWPTGMPGMTDLQDVLHVVDGVTVADRLMGEVDMGTPDWIYDSTDKIFYFDSGNGKSNGKFIITKTVTTMNPERYLYNTIVRVYDHNNVYQGNVATFKTAMSGVKLYYELATPERYTDLVYMGSSLFEDGTPVTLPVVYEADNWGMESILPENGSAILTSKPTIGCLYSIDAIETLDTQQTEIDNLKENKANTAGDYPEIVAGSARTLTGDVPSASEFTFRKTGAPDNVSDGIAVVKSYKGKTINWNQQVYSVIYNANIVTLDTSVTTEKKYIVNETVETSDRCLNINGLNAVPANHKALVRIVFKSNFTGTPYFRYKMPDNSFASLNLTNFERDTWQVLVGIINNGIVQGAGTGILPSNSGYVQGEYISVPNSGGFNVIDLTAMFGAGNEPSTVAEFEALYHGYHSYNPGTLISNAAAGLETVGFNQWDEEWELGNIDSDGQPIVDSDKIRTKNFIAVFPSKTYYIKGDSVVYYYDSEKNFISNQPRHDTTFETPSNCAYIKFRTGAGVTTYNHDICINISDTAKNGTYEPYKKAVLQLGLDNFDVRDGQGNVITITGGLKSAGSVYDEIKDGKYIKRIGSVDMGTLDWNYVPGDGYVVFRVGINNFKCVDSPATARTDGFVCSKYAASPSNLTSYTNMLDKSCIRREPNYIVIKDSAYNDAASFKTAMSGVLLYYELAEPEVYDLVNPIPTTFQEWGDGTEMRIPQDTANSVLAPFCMDVVYPMDAVGQLNDMPKDFDSVASLDALVSSLATTLGTALNGTLTITRGAYDATNKKYAWNTSFTPNA